ncbi:MULTISPECIES: DUF3618 domain-containing protein [Actinokineospora]|uniref:DUF3618 domain-containing protein n=1 Tax=Actinokineospora fastidiosa TaxID=1816 RepID=A0A918GHH0_9PSEU|nr:MULTISPECIES: DUF3618 domain-containing protein [Actinokineospora]UVS80076.1 hypothetical protein Actkin_03826 [Actinokineospora sp. UTMC 2448]GGS32894.1 hypothetical protein GCM10010171_28710 [Actinokineospora fastidiosa]
MSRQEDVLREDIKQARAELADTVELLVEKTDVRGRASAKADELRGRASAKAGQLRGRASLAGRRTAARVRRDPVPVAVGAVLGVGALGALARGLRH